MSRLAAIFGCAGPRLGADEAAFFRDARPWGFILFKRNVETPDQVRALVEALRETVGAPAPVLIDQEGGRVQRLGPPHWPRYPPGRAYGELPANDPLIRREVVRLGARLMAHDLAELGVNVDCAPVLDVPGPGAHDVIGDRAYAADAEAVAVLGRAAAEGLIAGGVLPVIKHMPGHGRAQADSHQRLPVVAAAMEALEATDFAPFRVNSDMPMGMTAHVVYTALDPERPATCSPAVIRRVIRGAIGFDGLLMTDDLSMKALSGGFEARAQAALAAGCDVALHCNGSMAEMKAVAAGARPLAGAAARRAKAALGRLAKAREPFDVTAARARFAAAFEGRWAA
ncbi:MAG: beta-N-acetylhexosaminidase [Caulobacteraceae bacterium]|nr:beta-N-acetylhexosaminidase [Caulobacteraceae bacterium]